MGTHWMTKYSLMYIEPTYFCPKHNKSKADAVMGTLSGVLEAAAKSKTITTLDEVENIYKNWACMRACGRAGSSAATREVMLPLDT